ncbi:MAG: c-type cytochrome [Candidatus Omnitrophica bacterium]|nr:c-type cytochrome [Candidatus Omnitrophota bacterium]
MLIRRWTPLKIFLGALLLGALGCLPPEASARAVSDRETRGKPALTQDLFSKGEALYQKQCASCHGPNGAGDGKAAYLLTPRPRDFTTGEFRLISTADMVPTEEDLFKTISRGMLGSAMPPWEHLSEKDRWGLVVFVSYLTKLEKARRRGEVTEERVKQGIPWSVKEKLISEPIKPEFLIQVPEEPAVTPESLARGREMFVKACAPCHGLEGRGDGQQIMKDNQGFPLKPRDLTSGLFKGESTSEALYDRLTAGLPGTPMPSYQDALTQEQIWELIHYVQTLSEKNTGERLRLRRNQIQAKKIIGELPLDPSRKEWQAVEPLFVALTPLWWRDNRIVGVEVRALHNGKQIAFLLSWADPTQDRSTAKPQLFSDGAAVQFSSEKDPPFFGMGGAEGAVHIWNWKASWQEETKSWEDIETVYPHTATDWYESDRSYEHGKPFETRESKAEFHDPLFMTAWGARNPLSGPARKSGFEEARAQGIGSLTAEQAEPSRGEAKGIWENGQWQLVFQREMRAGGSEDIKFKPGDSLSVAFAVWDGSAGDRDGQKSVSIWNELKIE